MPDRAASWVTAATPVACLVYDLDAMRIALWSLLVLAAMFQAAIADVRFSGSVHGTTRVYNHSPGDEDRHGGFGPGIGIDVLGVHPPTQMAYGVHVGWTTWDENDHNMDAHERYQVLQLHGFIEKRFSAGAIGAGLGFDLQNQRAYDVEGNYSYSNRHTMIGLDVQLVLDVLKTRSGTMGVVAGFAVFPLIDVAEILSGGEADVGWRGVTGSLGISFTL